MAYDRRGGRGGFRGGFSRRPRFGGRDFDVPKPIKVGEEYDVEINEVGSKGDGIARIKNFVVFVANSKKGEKIKVKITDVRNRFAIAEKVGEASSETAAEAPAEEATEAAEAPVEEAEEVSEAESEPEVETIEEVAEETEEDSE